MSQARENRKLLRGSFPKITSQDAKSGASPISELSSRRAPQFFAVASQDDRVARFKLKTRAGEVFSVPYSLLPVFVLSENKVLRVITHDIEVTIFGRGLDVVEDHLSQGDLLWLKESPSGTDDERSQVFVERMDILLNEDKE